MCARTKTTYGCGHFLKSTNDCHDSRCAGIDRFHYEKPGDCRECRMGGPSVTRGREGKGRYAQKIKKYKIQEIASSSSEEISTSDADPSGVASPWAPQNVQEKNWESPHRRQADEAWLSEHEDRLSDLQERLEKVTVSERRRRPKYTEEIVLDSETSDSDAYDRDESRAVVRGTPSKKDRRTTVRRNFNDRTRTEPHSQSRQDRQHSYDSLPDSMPSYRSSPKLKKAATYHVGMDFPDTPYDYDYYNSSSSGPSKPSRRHHHHNSSRAKTDQPRRSYSHYESDYDYEPAPPPPPMAVSLPAPMLYDSFYSPSGSPAAPYTVSDYRYEANHYSPQPRPQHYVEYRRF